MYTFKVICITVFVKNVTVNDNNWHHFAVIRNESNLLLFVDGVKKNSITLPSNWSLDNSSLGLNIGAQQNLCYFNGYIDELRVSKGIARWRQFKCFMYYKCNSANYN